MESKKIIRVKGASTHNLKSVDLLIPKYQFTVFTGVSGSGKSSLLFHTIYTEAQRQLIETFSTFARKRLPKLSKPAVEAIENISTPIIIDQKRLGTTLRSTVGTATEINSYLRMLYSRIGEPQIGPSFKFSFNHPEGMCTKCHGLGKRITIDRNLLIDSQKSLKEGGIVHPEFKVGGYYWQQAIRSGLFDPDKKLEDFSQKELELLLYTENLELKRSLEGEEITTRFEGIIRKLERLYTNKAEDEVSMDRKDVYQQYLIYESCPECEGTRLNSEARSVKVNGCTIDQMAKMELEDVDHFLTGVDGEIAGPLISKIRSIMSHLIGIGVGYLSLDRAVVSLSGGESQRLKMARQMDCDLTDMMYILDEPSIGLHPRDTDRLIQMLFDIRDKGNTVMVVEHDLDIIKAADSIIDMGPYAGIHGGEVVYQGSFAEYNREIESNSLLASSPSARVLQGEHRRDSRLRIFSETFLIENAQHNNLKNITVAIPKKVLCCITGVAGSGKSSLIHDVFMKKERDAVIIDQSPVGKSSRSTALSYLGAFDTVRKIFAAQTGQSASLFSFNSKGACPKCKGRGELSVEMNFMDDISITCDQCRGRRYKDEVLNLYYKGKNIADVLEMTAEEALNIFDDPEVTKRLKMLQRVGLAYLELGQALSQLSGGECQRLKLASELHKKSGIYVLDEPSTGLHGKDIEILMDVLHSLVDKGNSVIVIEHNLDIIAQADWVIDLGPEGGKLGGEVLFTGTPSDLILEVQKGNACKSYTGKYLQQAMTVQ